MGRFTDKKHGFTLYDVPKGGGTTTRLWIDYHYHGKYLTQTDREDYLTQNNQSYDNLTKLGYKVDWFQKVPGESICVKRDPIRRFVSCFNDKVLKEDIIKKTPRINEFVKNLERYHEQGYPDDFIHPDSDKDKKIYYLKYHFAPQWTNLGRDPKYYSHVFDISEVNSKLKSYLEEKWGTELEDLHARKLRIKSVSNLTDESKEILKEFYKEDYQIGWC